MEREGGSRAERMWSSEARTGEPGIPRAWEAFMKHRAWRGWRHEQTEVTGDLQVTFRGVDWTPKATEHY